MYLNVNELNTHLYEDELQSITRDNDTIALGAIDFAIAFAKSKLAKNYDNSAIFSAEGDNRNPLLLGIIKDIAVWRLIQLANPSVYYEQRKFAYEQANDWLDAVYSGMPADLPVPTDEALKNSSFTMLSNKPRKNYF